MADPTSPDVAQTLTLQPIQFKMSNGKWSDFSDDDEYNMKDSGISNPNDLHKYSRTGKQGQVETYSKNEREAEIKASSNLDTLKKIYNDTIASFEEVREGLKEQREDDKRKEDKRQKDLNKKFNT